MARQAATARGGYVQTTITFFEDQLEELSGMNLNISAKIRELVDEFLCRELSPLQKTVLEVMMKQNQARFRNNSNPIETLYSIAMKEKFPVSRFQVRHFLEERARTKKSEH